MPSVLVVDDSRRTRGFVARALEDAGCEVTIARDGDEAIRLLSVVHFDGMVIEIILPDTNGFETIVEVRRRWPGCRIVAMSGGGRFLTSEEALDIARVLGVHAELRKPFSAGALVAALGSAVSQPAGRG